MIAATESVENSDFFVANKYFLAGVSLLLGLSVYQTVVNSKLPATSDSLPLLGT
jgi:hypothetical protein